MMRSARHERTEATREVSLSAAEPDSIQARVSAILDEYLTRLEKGSPIDEDALLRQYPELSKHLQPHLASLRWMHGAMAAVEDSGSVTDSGVYAAPKRLGEYVLSREIGRGGMGIVYEAKNQTLNRRVALKVLPFAAVLNQKQIDRFRNEAQAAAQLVHPHIVPVYSVGVDRGVHYYEMQYIEGRPLSDAIAELRSLAGHDAELPETLEMPATATPPADRALESTSPRLGSTSQFGSAQRYSDRNYFQAVARLGIEVAQGIQHAHDAGIIHRDIKPSNLLIDQAGNAWITDFGLAHIPNDISVTATGDVLGTVRYMSPEQATGDSFVDHRTDIYSLGVTLYELLTLEPAFASENRQAFIRQVAHEEPTAPRRLNRAIPVDLETIVLKAISKSPADRYQQARQLEDDLQRFVDGRPTLARRPSLADRISKWSRRHQRVVAATMAVLLMYAVGSGVAATWLMQAQARTAQEQARTEVALVQANANLQQAQQNLEQAREIVDQLGLHVIEQLGDVPGLEATRLALLEKTQDYYAYILEQTDDGGLRLDRNIALHRSAKIADQLGQTEQALDRFRTARTGLEALIATAGPQDTDRRYYERELASCLNDEGLLLQRNGELELALEKINASLELQNELRSSGDEFITRDLARSLSNQGYLLVLLHREDPGRRAYEQAVQLHRTLVKQSPTPQHQRQLAVSLHNLAPLVVKTDSARARKICRQAKDIQQSLVKEHPERIYWQSDLALGYNAMGAFLEGDQQWEQAQAAYEQAIQIERRLVDFAPNLIGFQSNLAISYNNLGMMLLAKQEFRASATAFQQATEVLEQLVERVPHDVVYQSKLGGTLFNQGKALMALEEKSEALELWRAGLVHQQAAVDGAPGVQQFRDFLAIQTEAINAQMP